MARPTTRKGTANVTFRKRIPADVKRILDRLPAAYRLRGWGKDEIVITLGTADRRKAKVEAARVGADVEARIENLRRGVRKLSQREAVALSGKIYRAIASAFEDNPGSAGIWNRELRANAEARAGRFGRSSLLIADSETIRSRSMEERFGGMTDALLAAEGLLLDAESRSLVLRELARALDDAAAKLARNAEGDYRPDAAAGRFPAWTNEASKDVRRGGLSLLALFEKWAIHPEQAQQAPRTVSRYRGVFAAVSEFLNNPAAGTVTTDELNRYIEARMSAPEKPLVPRTVRFVHKAALSSVYGWAVGKRIVAHNPTKDLKIKVRDSLKLRPEEASDEEAGSISDAALAIASTPKARTAEAARRWCPMVCLYTGCRIGEITQLRKEDVIEQAGTPALRLTPEAGTIKDREFRFVPIHPRLIELGFITFVAGAPEGPLFFDPARRRRKDANSPSLSPVICPHGREPWV